MYIFDAEVLESLDIDLSSKLANTLERDTAANLISIL